MDVDRKVTIGYAMNEMINVGFGNSMLRAYVKIVYKALDVDYLNPFLHHNTAQ